MKKIIHKKSYDFVIFTDTSVFRLKIYDSFISDIDEIEEMLRSIIKTGRIEKVNKDYGQNC